MVSTTTISATINTTDVLEVNLVNATSDICSSRYGGEIPSIIDSYCNWTWDSFLCWPPTPINTIVRQQCPHWNGLDVTKYAERRCDTDGYWSSKPDSTRIQYPKGWTNYSSCYTDEMRNLMDKLYAYGTPDAAKKKMFIAECTRKLEIVGLSLSLFALLISLTIVCNIRSLRNSRTKIHKNLFVAMIAQVLVRLTLYFDQAVIPNGPELVNEHIFAIQNTPYLCESSYVLLEYARTAMFMWMFIEGLYMHNVVTVTVFQGRFPHTIFALLGWGSPLFITAIWATVTAKNKYGVKCWWGYNLTSSYWILEGPRLAVLLLNAIFLANIIRVLVVKLRRSHTSEIEQVRKAVRAAVFLIPLLGITNLLGMVDAPLDGPPFKFAMWSYSYHFLTSFQGLCIATLYCFLNNEVRAALMKSVGVYMSLRGNLDWLPRRHSMFSGAYATAADTESSNDNQNRNRQRQIQHNWITLCFNEKNMAKDKEKSIQRPSPETSV